MPSTDPTHPAPEHPVIHVSSTELEALVFLPADLVEELRTIRRQVPTWTCWADAKRDLSPARYAELVRGQTGRREPDPDEELTAEDVDTPEIAWPYLDYSEAGDCLPDDVYAEFAEPFEGFMTAGVHFPDERREEIEAALAARGITCVDDDLQKFFSFD